MKILKIILVVMYLSSATTFSFAEEPVNCNDLKTDSKYVADKLPLFMKRMGCKIKSGTKAIGSSISSSTKKILPK